MMKENRLNTSPNDWPRTTRGHAVQHLTSLPAGKMVPIASIPLLREDSVSQGQIAFKFEMKETAELLMNAVHVTAKAYLVPWLAMERFQGSNDILDRSYMGEPPMDGEDVIDFFETHEMDTHGSSEFYKYSGLHAQPGGLVNTMYVEAYNQVWNYRAKNRSRDLTPRDLDDETLAPAFWINERFKHIVPDFDQAVLDGEVALNVVDAQMKITAPGAASSSTFANVATSSDGEVAVDTPYNEVRQLYAELQSEGITISLSNIEAARKTQVFARLREKYEAHDDDYIIDMLMSGLSIPDQALKQPILLSERNAVFGMDKRHAMDAGNLDQSAVEGGVMFDLPIRMPRHQRVHTGGIIVVVAEITPEPLFERQKDVFLHLSSVEDLPEYVRDESDPEKVTVVQNDYIDIDHDTPNDTFGYAPLNFEWWVNKPTIGGRYYRPAVNALEDTDRQKLWAVETANPVLSEDFYVCTNMHQKPFLITDPEYDPFDVTAIGGVLINGFTVAGPALIEAAGNYDAIAEQVPQDRIEKGE